MKIRGSELKMPHAKQLPWKLTLQDHAMNGQHIIPQKRCTYPTRQANRASGLACMWPLFKPTVKVRWYETWEAFVQVISRTSFGLPELIRGAQIACQHCIYRLWHWRKKLSFGDCKEQNGRASCTPPRKNLRGLDPDPSECVSSRLWTWMNKHRHWWMSCRSGQDGSMDL